LAEKEFTVSIPAFKFNSGQVEAPQSKAYPTNRAAIEQSEGRSESDEGNQGNGTAEDESGGADAGGYAVPVR
jgi:hypothetical protein